MTRKAITGADIFDGRILHQGAALLLKGDVFESICAEEEIPSTYHRHRVDGGTIMPGFVDLQVNGGGGVMFNDDTSVAGLRTIADAHAATGTQAFLPTLITDTAERTKAAIDAVAAAIDAGVPGIVGLHLEGPHIAVAKKGAHDPALIRPMTATDETIVLDAVARLPNVMITVAPESVTHAQIEKLGTAGAIVALGHTDCSFAEAQKAFAAGTSCVTHLFNAMSQLGSRSPGLVGAALATRGIAAGLIADNIHVHAASIQIALDAMDPTDLFLVTDAMASVGSNITGFQLNGREVRRADGCLRLEDGTLAGADLTMPRALSVLLAETNVSRERAFAMATFVPAHLLKDALGHGAFTRGQPAHAIHLDPDCVYRGALAV
ncbi:N-acetylglucosamine-6-phosphate deacetylase [Cognatiyoonia sp. IB215446]|uniref:N-acetylglucosamine-6-phosphate deacetylase n=1 Tax=Cognatiyoonia sp. IB215446 TaxID=3097355 RepID=UPI002A1817EA|nr:N-acetylglucosamine-6-phosphate deacetylase [Cognatiyoonia sp. IB215446]MDX8348307.1 N-acetylglucosamine-6-phosphate deacetylase [Cognatiyoonia sp. IB215446]